MRDLARNGRCIRCEKAETGHLGARETVSDAIVKPGTSLAGNVKLNFRVCRVIKRTRFIIWGIFELFEERMAKVAWLSQ